MNQDLKCFLSFPYFFSSLVFDFHWIVKICYLLVVHSIHKAK